MKRRFLVTRGTSWIDVYKWRILELTEQPNLLTAKRRATISACLPPTVALGVAFRLFPGSEFFMWDELNYIPDNSMASHKALRVVASVYRSGKFTTATVVGNRTEV